MFDTASLQDNEGTEHAVNAAVAEADWKDLHHRLRSIAKHRIALEAKEAELLLEAEETGLYRRLGYTSMLEYMERELDYGPHAANERLRVAHALIDLPLTAELFGEGELSFSAVRELTASRRRRPRRRSCARRRARPRIRSSRWSRASSPGTRPMPRPTLAGSRSESSWSCRCRATQRGGN